MKKIVISTGGGDAPGLNAVIYAVVKSAHSRGWEVYGSRSGYRGLLAPEELIRLTPEMVADITPTGGTILGSTNKGNPFSMPVRSVTGEYQNHDVSDEIMKNFTRLGFYCHIAVGGDGSLEIAHRFATEKGMPVIGIPKTIDNDLAATDLTFGLDTAVATATWAIDALYSTAEAHDRVMILEVMGRDSGWIALLSGIAGGADVILIPEIHYDIDRIVDKIQERSATGHTFSIIVIGEGAKPVGGTVSNITAGHESISQRHDGPGMQLARLLEGRIDHDIRVTVLGHLQRGGSPSSFDRILGTRFGVHAAFLCYNDTTGQVVALKGQDVVSVPLEAAVANLKRVPPDGELVMVAGAMGIELGEG